MWFILSLVTIFFWGGSDLFSKMGSDPKDKYSHLKIVVAVGAVMGLHATFEVLTGTKFYPVDFLKYSPAIIFYVSSMVLGYIGLRYIMLSVSSPICNSSGAVACILCLVFLRQMPDLLSWLGIILVCIGVVGLAFVEKKYDTETAQLANREENKKYNVRDSVFKILFEKSFRDDSIDELLAIAKDEHIAEVNITNKVVQLVKGVLEHQQELDDIISKYSTTRSLNRIATANLIILRLAIYEVLFDDKVPTNTAVFEAVKLAEVYCSPKDVKFINGLLGAFTRNLEDNKA